MSVDQASKVDRFSFGMAFARGRHATGAGEQRCGCFHAFSCNARWIAVKSKAELGRRRPKSRSRQTSKKKEKKEKKKSLDSWTFLTMRLPAQQ